MKHLLKVLVQRIKESITETPEEEENSNQRNRPDGFPQGEFRCFGHFLIRDLERSLLEELFGAHFENISTTITIKRKTTISRGKRGKSKLFTYLFGSSRPEQGGARNTLTVIEKRVCVASRFSCAVTSLGKRLQ